MTDAELRDWLRFDRVQYAAARERLRVDPVHLTAADLAMFALVSPAYATEARLARAAALERVVADLEWEARRAARS